MANEFGEFVKSRRIELGLSLRDLANITTLSHSYIDSMERGVNPKTGNPVSPTVETLFKLAQGLNVKLEDMVSMSLPVSSSQLMGRINMVSNFKKLPILGTIRAGTPIIADENFSGELEVPADIKADFALEVRGDSMIGVGILDGDYALCRESTQPQTGQIIVALRDEGSISEATLKYFFNGNGHPCLKAANPSYPDIDYRDGYRCAGYMMALIRQGSPSYQAYKEYLAISEHEEWTGVIEKATGYGITPEQLSTNLDMQLQMIERMRKNKGK